MGSSTSASTSSRGGFASAVGGGDGMGWKNWPKGKLERGCCFFFRFFESLILNYYLWKFLWVLFCIPSLSVYFSSSLALFSPRFPHFDRFRHFEVLFGEGLGFEALWVEKNNGGLQCGLPSAGPERKFRKWRLEKSEGDERWYE